MPFINLMVTKKITEAEEFVIKTEFGLAMSRIGKSEDYLMINFQENCRMWFGGQNEDDFACVEVSLLDKASADKTKKEKAYEMLTADICEALGDVLSIPADKVYVKYCETPYWGWNSRMF